MIQGRPEISGKQKKIERNKSEKIKQDKKQTNKKKAQILICDLDLCFSISR